GFDPPAHFEGDLFFNKQPHLWGFLEGCGEPSQINGCNSPVHTTYELTNPTNEHPVGFYMLLGSWFGDFNVSVDNFLKATLAATNSGLAAMWVIDPHWRPESLGMGDILGNMQLRTVNDTNYSHGSQREKFILGDPTLRLQLTAPPSNPAASTNGQGQ